MQTFLSEIKRPAKLPQRKSRTYINQPRSLFALSRPPSLLPTHIFLKHNTYQWLISVGAGMIQVSDMLLTIALVVTLRRARTGVKRYVPSNRPDATS